MGSRRGLGQVVLAIISFKTTSNLIRSMDNSQKRNCYSTVEFCTISPAYHHEALARSESSVIEHNRRSERKYINSVISTIFSWDPCKVTLYSNITKRLTNKKQRKECPIQGRSLIPHSFPILTTETKTKRKTKSLGV